MPLTEQQRAEVLARFEAGERIRDLWTLVDDTEHTEDVLRAELARRAEKLRLAEMRADDHGTAVASLEEELREAQEKMLEMFNQACNLQKMGDSGPRYDHEFTSAYEEAQEYLIDHKMIRPEDCVRQ